MHCVALEGEQLASCVPLWQELGIVSLTPPGRSPYLFQEHCTGQGRRTYLD